jgi:hypothetical protein
MAAMIYALVTFHWRAKSISGLRGQGGFDDRWGPTVLAAALFAAVVVNFVLRLRDSSKNNNYAAREMFKMTIMICLAVYLFGCLFSLPIHILLLSFVLAGRG